MRRFFLCFFLSLSILLASDTYKLTYSSDNNCTLKKNDKQIALFDKRFKKTPPKNGYTCFSIQKEQYRDCMIEDKNNISALVFSYGVYGYTNFIIAFKSPSKDTNSSITVNCTKHFR